MNVRVHLLFVVTERKPLYVGVNTCVTMKMKATAVLTEALLYFAGRNHTLLM